MFFDRVSGNAAAVHRSRSHLASSARTTSGGAGLEESLVVPGALRLFAVRHLQGAIEGVGMRRDRMVSEASRCGNRSASAQAILPPQSWPTR
jgi:hypothetical protein